MTESECLVFTEDKVILVYLIDKTQKNISLPQGLKNIYGHSLNVMINSVPFLIVATPEYNQQIKCEIEEKCPDQCHNIGQKNVTHLLTVMQYNIVEQKLNEKIDLKASATVKGDLIASLLQYSVDSIMFCGMFNKTAIILSLPSMQKTKSISINTEVASDNYE